MRDPDLDPPTVQGDVSGGISDKALLIISTIGFALLGSVMYVLLLSPRKNDDETDGDDGERQQRNWDDELDEADVRTLNRAQRRARAKNRMKKSRRVAPLAQPRRDGEGDGGDRDGEQQQLLEAANEGDGEEDEAQPLVQPQQHLSRKERTRLAKQAEREERRLYEEERREARREYEENAAVEKRLRERERRVAAEEERRRKALEVEERVRIEFEEWTMMFVKSRGEGCRSESVTVRDFVDYLKRHKVVAMDDIAAQFQVSLKDVEERLGQLEKEGRINGVINDRGDYVYLRNPDDMRAICDFVDQKGRVSLSELAEKSSLVLSAVE